MLSKYHKIIGVIVFLLLLVVVLFRFNLSYTIHDLVNIFAGGKSYAKVLGFIIFTLILYLLSFFKTDKVLSCDFLLKNTKVIFLISISFVFLSGILMHFYFVNKFNFPIDSHVVSFNNGEISSSKLSHNHITKGFVGGIVDLFGYSKFENIDSGGAYLGIIPNNFYLIFFLFILICFISICLIFILSKDQYKDNILYIPIFSALSFGLLEHAFDGGIFDPRTILLLGIFLFLIFDSNRKNIKLIFSSIAIFIIFSFIFEAPSSRFSNLYIQTFFYLLAFMSMFIIPVFYIKNIFPHKYKYFYLFLFIFFVSVYIHISDVKNYINVKLENDDVYIALYGEYPELEKIDTINDLNIFRIKNDKYQDLKEIFRDYKIISSIYPVSVPWKTCVLGDIKMFNLDLISKDIPKLDLNKTNFASISVYKNESVHPGHINSYKVIIALNGCTPRRLNVLEEIIKSVGFNQFFIMNIKESKI